MASVLVVDDSTSVCRIASLILSFDGHEVSVASDGLQALDLLSHKHVDLMILDLEMPNMDGWTTFREARREGYEGPVVILSAFGAKAAARQLRADDAISKPFDPEDLLSQVRKHLSAIPSLL